MPAPFELDNAHQKLLGRTAVKKRKTRRSGSYIAPGYKITSVVIEDGIWMIEMESLVDGRAMQLQECSFNLFYEVV